MEQPSFHLSTAELNPDQLARLLEISTRLSSTLHLDNLLSLIMDVATELTNTEAASILLLDESSNQLHFAASIGNTMPQDIVVPLDRSIAGWVVQNGRYLIIDDVQTDQRFFASVDQDTQFQTQTMLAIPLHTSDKVIGALEVINKRGGQAYTEQDVALMEALASQAAVAIVNARLFEQSDLLAEIMHELKTPMMAIHAAADLLSRPEFPQDKQETVVQMIKRESKRLSKMTRDFLDLARLESRRLRMERQEVSLVPLVKEVVEITRAQAAERGLAIETVVAPERAAGAGAAGAEPASSSLTPSNYCVWGDVDRLKQVLINLVSNAIKYNGENGRIVINVYQDNGWLCLTVTDSGPGISAEDAARLFDRFYRIPGSQYAAEGSGLGLTIAHKIVEQHQGEITISSQLGEGTTFIVRLPPAAS
ncbi:MAG: GAF domain-containing sensor histidine kinase [Chloroflexota bacterium]